MIKIIKKFSNVIKEYFVIEKFKKHNKKIFNQESYDSNSIILVEFNAFQTSHIALSYVSNLLKKKFKVNVHAYYAYSIIVSRLKENLIIKIKWFLSNFFSLKNMGIYKSFGVKKIFKPNISKEIEVKAKKVSDDIFKNLKSKGDLLNVFYKDVLIGDLIYDTYLKSLTNYTLDIKDTKLKNMIFEFYCLCFYWDNFFDKKNVKALLCIHTVYSYAIPIRVAIFKNISVYAMNMERLFSLSKTNYLKGTDFKYYPEEFKTLSLDDQKKGKKLAKQKLLDRFEGKTSTDIDLPNSMVSSFSKVISKKNVIKQSKNIKVLITPHDFMDSIHVLGDLLFPDFYEWLIYLGKISSKTNYDWYIKNRPKYPGKFKKYQPFTNKTVEEIVSIYPNLKLLDNEISHHQLIKEGINFVFTGYGSVGLEYPNFGIPVINACEKNPHYRYNFNITPKTIKEYEGIILNLSQNAPKINNEEIYEFYFMRHVYHNRKWLTRSHKEMVKILGGYNDQFSSKLYNYWVDNYSTKEHKLTENYINNFMQSGDFLLSIKHQKNL